MFLDCAGMFDEGVAGLGLRTYCQHRLIKGMHQSMHLAEQQSADTAPPRACPDTATRRQKTRIILLVQRTGSAERGSNGARHLLALHGHPAAVFDHRIDRLDFPPGLGVIENGFVRPELAGDGTSRLVKRCPVDRWRYSDRMERYEWS
jgi:hypothetical protein